MVKRFLGMALVGGFCLIAGGCSWIVRLNDGDQLCDSDGSCPSGYSCLVTSCVADDTLAKGNTCNDDVQCAGNMICAPEFFHCTYACDDYYSTTSQCDSDEYCQPVKKPTAEGDWYWMGVCNPGIDCLGLGVDESCEESSGVPASENTCEVLGRNVGTTVSACVQGCELAWDASTGWSDNCGGTALEPKSCTPFGAEGDTFFLCLDSSLEAASEGEACEPIENPCQQSLGCIDGICRRYCPVGGEECPAGSECIAVDMLSDGLAAEIGYCLPN